MPWPCGFVHAPFLLILQGFPPPPPQLGTPVDLPALSRQFSPIFQPKGFWDWSNTHPVCCIIHLRILLQGPFPGIHGHRGFQPRFGDVYRALRTFHLRSSQFKLSGAQQAHRRGGKSMTPLRGVLDGFCFWGSIVHSHGKNGTLS